MAREGYAPTAWLTAAEATGVIGQGLSGYRIVIVDANRQPTGATMESGAAGAAPQASATAAGVEPVSLTASNAPVALTQAAHAGASVHAEAGVTALTIAAADWPGGGEVWVINHTQEPLPIQTLGAGLTGYVNVRSAPGAASGVASPATLVTLAYLERAIIQVKGGAFVNIAILTGAEPEKGWAAATAYRSGDLVRAPSAQGSIGAGDRIIRGTAGKSRASFDATEAALWSELAEDPDTTSELAAKQATLVSGTNIRTVNGSSIVGAGNVAVAADLPGGAAATAFDDGLGAGNAVIDRATAAGQTILRYATAGTSIFVVPAGVTEVRALVVAGGGGGGSGVGGDLRGGGGGSGGLISDAAFAVTPGASLTVTTGAGGAAAVTGSDSVFATLTADGGGRGGSGAQTGFAGGSGGGGGAPSGGAASFTGGAGTVGEGNDGGTGGTDGSTYRNGGGGGGASVAGAAGSANGTGGAGVASTITGASVTYAGGGGGGGPAAANGGAGGGGRGGAYSAGAATAGSANTGGGGGGGANTVAGAAGGSGVVIVRFLTQTRAYQALGSFGSNALALAGGLLVGQFYRDSANAGAVAQVQ